MTSLSTARRGARRCSARRSARSPTTRSPRAPPRSTRPAEFPWDVYDALVAADLHAVHVPEEYGGAGADALATVIVIEEVARACASSSLIPAVNKLGTMPLLLSGLRGAQAAVPAAGRQRRGDVLLRLSEPEAGSRRRRDEDPGGPRRRPLRAQRREALDHQRRRVGVLHGDGRRPTRRRAPAASPRSSWRRPTRASRFGAPEKKLGIKGSPTREVYFDNVRDPGRPDDRRAGHRLQDRAAHPGPHPASPSPPRRSASPRARSTTRSATSRSASSSARPIADFQGVQFMLADMAMKLEAARQLTYAAAAKSERPCTASRRRT